MTGPYRKPICCGGPAYILLHSDRGDGSYEAIFLEFCSGWNNSHPHLLFTSQYVRILRAPCFISYILQAKSVYVVKIGCRQYRQMEEEMIICCHMGRVCLDLIYIHIGLFSTVVQYTADDGDYHEVPVTVIHGKTIRSLTPLTQL